MTLVRLLAAAAAAPTLSLAIACGCFAAPNPTVLGVQAGKHIVFAVKVSVRPIAVARPLTATGV